MHVAELSIDGALFHLHEDVLRYNKLCPQTLNGTSIAPGLFVNDPYFTMAKAVAAGTTELEPVKDYDYAYRRGYAADPFGHIWFIEKRLGNFFCYC